MFEPPFPRGTGNPCMKDISVRIDHNEESEMFDRLDKMKSIPKKRLISPWSSPSTSL